MISHTPTHRFAVFDMLSTLAVVLDGDGRVVYANPAVESATGLSQRMLQRSDFAQYLSEPELLRQIFHGSSNSGGYAALRFDTGLQRSGQEPLFVHVTVAPVENSELMLAELWVLEQQARQDREERLVEQAQANKELIRNLAHEIKNPLGGIRGAAQLLEMDLPSPELREYTQVIIHEADRLQNLVDRLLAPHRHPHLVGDVNIHEVCERVRSLILLEHPNGLSVRRDYDISIPEFRGDRVQLIQAVLNIVQNAAQVLTDRIERADAQIVLRTRVARQVTIGRQRHKLALELHVIDNGPGVPEQIKRQIFNPLVTAREGGTGLGLPLAQTFVQRHQGLIECESVPGRTDFRILIPLLALPPVASHPL